MALPALKMDGPTGQKRRWPLEAEKCEETDSSLNFQKRNQPCQQIFHSVRSISDF